MPKWKEHNVFFSIAILLILAAPLSLVIFLPVHVLEITHSYKKSSVGKEAKRGGRVYWTPVKPGDRFSLAYTHSVQLCRVVDDLEIDRHYRICLVSTSFSDHGVGLPYSLHKGGNFSIQDDGGFSISGMHAPLPEILLRVGREYDNTFTFGSRRINLSETYGDALLEVRIKKYRFPFSASRNNQKRNLISGLFRFSGL